MWVRAHMPGYSLNCWCLQLWSLWTASTCGCPLSWLLIWLRSEVVNPCFIHCHIFTQKLLFVALKQLETTLWIVDVLLFLIDCEQTQHSFWTLTSHWQMFIDKWWIHCLLISSIPLRSHATSICSVFGVFRDNYGIWVTRAFSIICVCTTTFKVSIPLLNRCFRRSRVRITLIKPLLCLNIWKQCFINTWNSDFSIVLKICNSKL